jgi:hypothetical protein
MQAIGPRLSTLGTQYSAAQVRALLQQPVLLESVAFERIHAGASLGEFTSSVREQGAVVAHDTTRTVCRTLQATVRQDAGLDWYNDWVRVWRRYGASDGGWIDVLLGTFVPVAPGRTVDDSATWRTLVMGDVTQIFNDTNLTQSLTIAAGAGYLASAIGLAQQVAPGPYIAQPDARVLPASLSWPAGTSVLTVINALLKAIGYQSLWADEAAVLRFAPLFDFASQPPAYLFDLTQPSTSQALHPFNETRDTTQAFNACQYLGQDPRQAVVSGYYENVNPLSEVSTVNFRKKLVVITNSAVADVASATVLAKNAVQQASRAYRPEVIETVDWPFSQHLDVYAVAWNNPDDGLQIANHLETAWTMKLEPGGATQHSLQLAIV